jgi:hypothetical protein
MPDTYDSTIPFLGTVSSDGSGDGPYIGHFRVVIEAPSGMENPYLGKVKFVAAVGGSSDALLGQVIVIVDAPSADASDLGNAGT